MSTGEQTQNAALSDFHSDTTEDTHEVDASEWQPQGGRECQGCGAPVSARYARVQGDNQNEVHECRNCPDSNVARRLAGGAAGLNVEDRKMTTSIPHQ